MKFISWNVNGLRACISKGFMEFVNYINADFICLQEIKAFESQLNLHIDGFKIFWNSANRAGYSGTAIITKHEPISVHTGISDIPDIEGRVLILEYPTFYLINVYTPNSKRELERLEYRKLWDAAFKEYLEELNNKKPIIICGDFNVAHNEIDIARPSLNHNHAGFTNEERTGFSNLLQSGFIDTFRFLNPNKSNAYSWWSYLGSARQKNIGWRLDYFLVSEELKIKIKDADILSDVYGSDHCPISLNINL